MNYTEYRKLICEMPETEGLEYQFAVLWLHPNMLPIGVVSLNGCTDKIIRVPLEAVNRYGNKVPVIAVGQEAFRGNTEVTDIILSSNITKIGNGAFAGCTSLERITLPRSIRDIWQNTFDGCISLRDIYYEGTLEEWNRIDLHGEQNEALKLANIHLRCKLPGAKF